MIDGKKMKFANNIHIRVFCRKDEDEVKILDGLKKIINFSDDVLKDEKLEIKKTEAKGFDEKIKIFEFKVEKSRHINHLLKNLNEQLTTADKERLCEQENRLDENLDFYIRLSKPLILENLFELTETGDCYHIKINIAAFPKNKETAKDKIKETFK
jgi:RNA binding exosome subunit